MRQYHPDLYPNNPDAHKKFVNINEAYEVLFDDKKKYDQLGSDYQKYKNAENADNFDWSKYLGNTGGYTYTYQGDINDLFGEDGFSDFFKNIFGGRDIFEGFTSRKNNYSFKGNDYKSEMRLTLEEAYAGCTRMININEKKIRINLMPGIKDGQSIKLAGKGSPCVIRW